MNVAGVYLRLQSESAASITPSMRTSNIFLVDLSCNRTGPSLEKHPSPLRSGAMATLVAACGREVVLLLLLTYLRTAFDCRFEHQYLVPQYE